MTPKSALMVGQFRFAPHLDAARLGTFAAFAGVGPDQIALELGEAAKVRCRLYRHSAPHSFFWRIEYSSPEGWKTGLLGGLIYSGPGGPSDGSAPSFRVSLNPDAAAGGKHMCPKHPTSEHYTSNGLP